ncbi:MAG: hypothetical protein KDA62_11220 [Planctomycetales bacterium]|nr:hypothetical protein [Planctomycetales bacterium]
MRPLVSGPEAKRYRVPITNTFLLFPYDVSRDTPRLRPVEDMQSRFPNAWKYLKMHESILRSRERFGKREQQHKKQVGPFDDERWYRFGRNQNIDKQELAKLGVAETVPELRLFADTEGTFCFNNVRVNGIVPANSDELFYLLGILNSPFPNWFFRLTAKPKDNGYFEANRQFIAPLPIPKANKAQKKKVGGLAQRLQTLHTARRDSVAKLQRRIDSPQCVADARRAEWLWADVDPNYVKQFAAAGLSARERTTWTKGEIARRLESHYEEIAAHLRPRVSVHVQADDDALILLVDTTPVLAKYGLEPAEAQYLAALWRQILRGVNITSKFTAEKLVAKLLDLRTTSDLGLRQAILALDAEIQVQDCDIDNAEREINALIYQLYDLTGEEISLVESQQ